MSDLRTAAQSLLDACEQRLPLVGQAEIIDELNSIRAALAEPTCKEGLQVEPVAWRYKGEPWFDGNRWHDKFEVTTDERVAKFKDKDATPLYAAPPQRKPLTEGKPWVCACGVNLYIDADGKPRSKA